jgi:putative membrane protein
MKLLTTIACAILLSHAVYANDNIMPDSEQPGTMAGITSDKAYDSAAFRKDMGFNMLNSMHQSEIELAKLGQERAMSQEVKNFAMQLQRDHEAAAKKLSDTAKAQNIELQVFQAASFQTAAWDNLKELSGSNFDRAFMDYVKTSHEWMNESLARMDKDTKDPTIKAQVAELKPKFEQHLKGAKAIKVPAAS